MSYEDDYKKYRGKCKEMCDELVAKDPSLKLVRGHYYEPQWNRDEPHWWCVDSNGKIVDPTRKQFPSQGQEGFYTEFDGTVDCAECGRIRLEKDIHMQGNYPVCKDTNCALKLIGLA